MIQAKYEIGRAQGARFGAFVCAAFLLVSATAAVAQETVVIGGSKPSVEVDLGAIGGATSGPAAFGSPALGQVRGRDFWYQPLPLYDPGQGPPRSKVIELTPPPKAVSPLQAERERDRPPAALESRIIALPTRPAPAVSASAPTAPVVKAPPVSAPPVAAPSVTAPPSRAVAAEDTGVSRVIRLPPALEKPLTTRREPFPEDAIAALPAIPLVTEVRAVDQAPAALAPTVPSVPEAPKVTPPPPQVTAAPAPPPTPAPAEDKLVSHVINLPPAPRKPPAATRPSAAPSPVATEATVAPPPEKTEGPTLSGPREPATEKTALSDETGGLPPKRDDVEVAVTVAPAAPPAENAAPAETRDVEVAAVAPQSPSESRDGSDLSILFAPGDAALPSDAEEKLLAMAEALSAMGDARLQLKAYADGESSASAARRLSLSRALSVRSFLIDAGVQSTRIDVRALGAKFESGPADRVDVVRTR